MTPPADTMAAIVGRVAARIKCSEGMMKKNSHSTTTHTPPSTHHHHTHHHQPHHNNDDASLKLNIISNANDEPNLSSPNGLKQNTATVTGAVLLCCNHNHEQQYCSQDAAANPTNKKNIPSGCGTPGDAMTTPPLSSPASAATPTPSMTIPPSDLMVPTPATPNAQSLKALQQTISQSVTSQLGPYLQEGPNAPTTAATPPPTTVSMHSPTAAAVVGAVSFSLDTPLAAVLDVIVCGIHHAAMTSASSATVLPSMSMMVVKAHTIRLSALLAPHLPVIPLRAVNTSSLSASKTATTTLREALGPALRLLSGGSAARPNKTAANKKCVTLHVDIDLEISFNKNKKSATTTVTATTPTVAAAAAAGHRTVGVHSDPASVVPKEQNEHTVRCSSIRATAAPATNASPTTSSPARTSLAAALLSTVRTPTHPNAAADDAFPVGAATPTQAATPTTTTAARNVRDVSAAPPMDDILLRLMGDAEVFRRRVAADIIQYSEHQQQQQQQAAEGKETGSEETLTAVKAVHRPESAAAMDAFGRCSQLVQVATESQQQLLQQSTADMSSPLGQSNTSHSSSNPPTSTLFSFASHDEIDSMQLYESFCRSSAYVSVDDVTGATQRRAASSLLENGGGSDSPLFASAWAPTHVLCVRDHDFYRGSEDDFHEDSGDLSESNLCSGGSSANNSDAAAFFGGNSLQSGRVLGWGQGPAAASAMGPYAFVENYQVFA